LLFFCKNHHFFGYKCVSIQNFTLNTFALLLRSAAAECAPTCCYAAAECESIQAQKLAIFVEKIAKPLHH